MEKLVADSMIEMREMVMPHHSNPQGTVFGGTVMSWIDIAAAMCAAKHANKPVVTVHVDRIHTGRYRGNGARGSRRGDRPDSFDEVRGFFRDRCGVPTELP